MAPSNTSCFFSCSCSMRSSIVPFVINRTAVTGLVWPMRWARWIACISTAGFHHGSSTKTRVATCKLRPSPPALSDMRMTCTLGSRLKASMAARRWLIGMEPSSMTSLMPSLLSRHSTISSIRVYWENTMALLVLSSLSMSMMPLASASTFELLVKFLESILDMMERPTALGGLRLDGVLVSSSPRLSSSPSTVDCRSIVKGW
mmetsp:Transcript_13524/g.49204  ORF Transcript_13524/g.49204 Transcript_13524/m.49204 type:complete len:203 (+) Transcript_13524:223-831(+)